jgi:hypothetical protein
MHSPGTTTSDAVLMVTVHVLLVLTVVEVGEQLSVDFVASGVCALLASANAVYVFGATVVADVTVPVVASPELDA